MKKRYEDEYFLWLTSLVKNKSHGQLLRFLFETDYIYQNPMDANRADDGIQLRYEFIYDHGIDERDFSYLYEPCNVFEMILALARRISLIMESPNFMDDSDVWFWRMISNLGLNKQIDRIFDYDYVRTIIRNFLTNNYGPYGYGSLFHVTSRRDTSKLQIWEQAMIYLNEFEERRMPHGIFD